MEYKDQIKHPKWQKKRLEILERDEWTCVKCQYTDKTLNVHHLIYHKMHMIWEYENKELISLCEKCHQDFHNSINIIKECLVVHNYDVLLSIERLLRQINTNTPHDITFCLEAFKLHKGY